MFSIHDAHKPELNSNPTIENIALPFFNNFIENNNLCACLLCKYDQELCSFSVIVSSNIEKTPFNGPKKHILNSFLIDCFEKHPKPHVHSIANTELWKEIGCIIDNEEWQTKAIYLPVTLRNQDFILLCFSSQSNKLSISNEILSEVTNILDILSFFLLAEKTSNRLKIMEIYVKEVGHDIASSIQAIIAKLRNVSKGIIQGPHAIKRIKEAEEEIMSTYRIADTLGITIDPDYNIKGGKDFDLLKALNN